MEGWYKQDSPFHPGEKELHTRLGIGDKQEELGRRIMRPFMPQQHRDFFAGLPFVILGSVDRDGSPWASMLPGSVGFVTTPTDRTMRIDAKPLPGDPLSQGIAPDAPVSLLGIELRTRRRNRANLRVDTVDDKGMDLRLIMSFGNCPQYIQARSSDWSGLNQTAPKRVGFDTITTDVRDVILKVDTLFVASHNDRDDPNTNGGVDVNHRGGKPGFVKIDGNTLTIPDFPGNNAFNTLGNFLVNPKAGLLFADFDNGDLIQMTGEVELLWEPTPEVVGFEGALRAWRFTLTTGGVLKNTIPANWQFDSYAKQLDRTGHWID